LPPRPSRPDAAPETALEYLSVTLSHPRWLVSRWFQREGFEATERWLQFNNAAAPLTIRTNRSRTTTEALARDLAAGGVETTPARYAPDALLVTAGNALATTAFHDGDFIVQDEASQLVATFAGARPGENILDACASPGGKTVVMANDSRGEARIVACDVRERRVRLLRETLARTGVRAWVLQADLLNPLPLDPVFDCVLVDAPCSGLGTLRRDPDIKWRRHERDLQPLAAAQARLIANAADVVRPGGRLVYATCSSEPEENEAIVAGLLRSRADFRQATADEVRSLPGWPVVQPVCLEQGVLHTWPHRHGLEAFFGAVLVKAEPL
jgi:16S rRNA (cytosine967-C5)-methyltransferase